MAIGVAYVVASLMACASTDLAMAPPQWKVILVAGAGGLLGSLIDSLIGTVPVPYRSVGTLIEADTMVHRGKRNCLYGLPPKRYCIFCLLLDGMVW